MPYRLRGETPLVAVKDQYGKIIYYYARPTHGMSGPIIPWISDEQAAHLLRLGYIERVDDDAPADAESVDQQAVNMLIAELDRLEVATDAGSPTAREVLRAAGHHAPNELIAAAVKLRKRSHGVVA